MFKGDNLSTLSHTLSLSLSLSLPLPLSLSLSLSLSSENRSTIKGKTLLLMGTNCFYLK